MEAFNVKECIVCGKATEQRCSGCKKLFFCSSAHQKLLWITHKHLCGKDHFEQPPLRQEEVEWALGHRDALSDLNLDAVLHEQRARDPALENAPVLQILSGLKDMATQIRDLCQLTGFPGYDSTGAYSFRSFAQVTAIELNLALFLPSSNERRLFDPLLEQSVYVYTLLLHY
ncbi:hypothetical protein BCR35DRAFT_328348 [Leucosporidium creatinivorum]|uniref:MYND-type domain-containing protein n=1 Tax=Leucosporidium creatinivorum TaxID=106004 RepID=A0A1Y2G6Y6_9BASI|nr:hypothetical protein BCR35DRAFT_328348 [Leucosporidium creatinivorum]